jgi:hypothetical protein
VVDHHDDMVSPLLNLELLKMVINYCIPRVSRYDVRK